MRLAVDRADATSVDQRRAVVDRSARVVELAESTDHHDVQRAGEFGPAGHGFAIGGLRQPVCFVRVREHVAAVAELGQDDNGRALLRGRFDRRARLRAVVFELADSRPELTARDRYLAHATPAARAAASIASRAASPTVVGTSSSIGSRSQVGGRPASASRMARLQSGTWSTL